MSTETIFKGIVGGVIGFVVGGPAGAYIGFSLGVGLGLAEDFKAIKPDDPLAAGSPQLSELQVTSNIIGKPIPDLLGTSKIAGQLIAFGKERSNTPDPVNNPALVDYYMTWAQAICVGETDTLLSILKENDEIVWIGEVTKPVSGGQEAFTIPNLGNVTFYFGTTDQVAHARMAEIISDPEYNTPYRNICYMLFDDCYIGNTNRLPVFKFVIKKTPDVAELDNLKKEISTYNYNPAHAIWYIMETILGLSSSWLDTTDFASVVDTLYSESLGISILFGTHQEGLSYLQTINSHIDLIIKYGSDGKFHPKLIRNDYVVDDLPTIDDSIMLEDPTFVRPSWLDTLNEIKVQYSEIYSYYPNAGYFMGGTKLSGIAQRTVGGFLFLNETAFTVFSARIDQERIYGAGVNSAHKGYCIGGDSTAVGGAGVENVIDDYDFVAATSDVIVAILDTAKSASAGVNSPIKGYIMGGYDGIGGVAVIEDIIFIDESSQAIVATLDTAKYGGAGINSGIKGYIIGGDTGVFVNVIEDLIFSDESSQAIAATLDALRGYGAGVNSVSKGYILGGEVPGGAETAIIEDLIFSDESSQTIVATLDTAKRNGAGVNSDKEGFIICGGVDLAKSTVIEELVFATETSQALSETTDLARTAPAGFQSGNV